MFTVLSNTRNSNFYLLSALAIVIAVLLTITSARPLSNASASADNPASYYGSPAFYEYRRGEWGISITDTNPDTSNSEFRQDERTASLSPDLRDFANYQHRQGECFGK